MLWLVVIACLQGDPEQCSKAVVETDDCVNSYRLLLEKLPESYEVTELSCLRPPAKEKPFRIDKAI